MSSMPARVPEGTALLHENGYFFVLTGTCQYWIGGNAYADYVTGTLTEAEAAQLDVDLRIADWGTEPIAQWMQSGTFDVSDVVYSDGERYRILAGFLDPPANTLPAVPRALWTWRGLQELLSRATPVGGPVRFRLFPAVEPLEVPTAPWPLAVDPESVLEGREAYLANAFGMARLVTDPVASEALRLTRRTYGGPAVHSVLPIGDGSRMRPRYALVVRDTIPLEDPATGFIPGLLP